MKVVSLVGVVSLLLAGGCGGESTGAEGEGTGGLGGTGAQPGTGGTSGTGATGGAGGTGGATGGATGTGGATALTDVQELFPLVPGRTWEFSVTQVDPAGLPASCDNPVSTLTEPGTYLGHTGVFYSYACSTTPVLMTHEGGAVMGWAEHIPNGFAYAVGPLVEGAVFGDFVWHDRGTVTVPAGTFTDCWERESVSLPGDYIVLCTGVGVVESVNLSPESNAHLVLESYTP